MLEEQRENWGTRGGFVLAAVGSAVGLGNLWGFPYKLYDHGGGAFLVPYVAAMFIIGIPMLILEFSLGHFTQRAAPDAFAKTNRKLEFVGWWGIILGFVIITYYPIILAWCVSFLWFSIQGIFNGGQLPWAGEGMQGVENIKTFFNDKYLGVEKGFSFTQPRWNIVIPLVIAWALMYFCIFRGVKLVGKIVWLTVPLPWLMLFILAVRGLTLEGSMRGLVYFLEPNWHELTKPDTWRFAFGQVFFSLSLAFGVMITYSSFLHRKSDINNNAAIIGIADFTTSFIAGIAIFATLGGMAFVTSQHGQPVPVDKVVDGGPGLAFVAFPYALAQLPGSAWWSFVFFFTLLTLGVDSAFSISESVLAAVVDKTGWKRSIVLPVLTVIGIILGLIFAMNTGINWLGTVDAFVNGTWGIIFMGMLQCLVLGWFYRIENLRSHANERSDWNLGKWWNYAIRVLIPVALGTLFFWNLHDDIEGSKGFLTLLKGDLKEYVAIVLAAPALAIIISLFKSPKRERHYSGESEMLNPIIVSARKAGFVIFIIAFFSAEIVELVAFGYIEYSHTTLYICAIFSALCLIASNILIDANSGLFQRPSWYVRFAGVFSTLTISGIIALVLIEISNRANYVQEEIFYTDSLSVYSYIIMAIVFLAIIGGLSWCFYRAIAANTENIPQQSEA
jgi:NSS family neurotransmitter:Na+ symporter